MARNYNWKTGCDVEAMLGQTMEAGSDMSSAQRTEAFR